MIPSPINRSTSPAVEFWLYTFATCRSNNSPNISLIFGFQALATSDSVAHYICGYAIADGPLLSGATWRGYMEVDMDICGDDAVFSVVSMLSELLFVRGWAIRY